MTTSDGAALYTRLARLWLAATLVVVGVNAIALALPWARRSDSLPGLEAELRQALPGIDAAALARETPREFMQEVFTQFRERPGTGRYVNIEPAGFRRSAPQAPWPPEADRPNVFLFGGSTAFGYGAADEQTLASLLQTGLANRLRDRPPRVYNFGRGGYFSAQERILFEQLVVGGARPDLAVFVDGVDEFMLADGRPALTAVLERFAARRRAQGLRFVDLPVVRLFANQATGTPLLGFPVPLAPPEDPALAAPIVERYLRNRRLTEHEATAMGVRTLFVWQPASFAAHGSAGTAPLAAEGYRRLAATMDDRPPEQGFAWCAGERPAPGEVGYLDGVHYAPAMTARLAACIAAAIEREGLLG
jgi:hypothetical protein